MNRFDIVVIGGGPAGMMAAARAAQYGAKVALVEKNGTLGNKLMITGRGRCNFAHVEDDVDALAATYRHGGEFILPALKRFGYRDISDFLLRRGVVPVQERGNRLYPRDDDRPEKRQDATSVLNAFWTALKDGAVRIFRGYEVRNIDVSDGHIERIITAFEEIGASSFIIATGGLSFPSTGSGGDGYTWAKKCGHTLRTPTPALCPVKIAERFSPEIFGLKLKNVSVTLHQNGEIVDERFGEMDFTPFGISGAIIMDMASSIAEHLRTGLNLTLHVDLRPGMSSEKLLESINEVFEERAGQPLTSGLRKYLPAEIIPTVLSMARYDTDEPLDDNLPCGETYPEERVKLRDTIKNFVITPTDLLGFKHAIVTSGGVNTDEVDPNTMKSKIVDNLYFAGEVLDVDGPTGGYNLQECWSTGFVAGSSAAEDLGFATPTEEEIVQHMAEAQAKRREEDLKKREEKEKQRQMKLVVEQETRSADAPEEDEEMTIKTGPVDDREFCGWRDPRSDKNMNNTPMENSTEGNSGKREDRGDRRNFNRDDRPRYNRDDRGGDKRSFNRDDRPRYNRDDRGGDRRSFNRDDRPRYNKNDRGDKRR